MGLVILISISLLALLNGFRMLKGGSKSWFFARHLYAGGVYAQIPVGIAFFFFTLATIPQEQDISLILVYIGVLCGLLGVIFNFLRPSFLKPAWLKWLERKHGEIMPILDKEAYEMGLETWEKHVDNQGLAVWVAEVRRKNGLPEKPMPAKRRIARLRCASLSEAAGSSGF